MLGEEFGPERTIFGLIFGVEIDIITYCFFCCLIHIKHNMIVVARRYLRAVARHNMLVLARRNMLVMVRNRTRIYGDAERKIG
jgi:hypothetical protein